MSHSSFANHLPPLPRPDWRKSSFSNGNGGNNCVEVAVLDTGVAVRHSKERHAMALVFSADEWTAFVAGAKNGEFDL